MARWTASAKWGEAPALDGQRDMPLALRLSKGLGSTGPFTRDAATEVDHDGDDFLPLRLGEEFKKRFAGWLARRAP